MLSIRKHQLLSILLLIVLTAVDSFATEGDDLRQKLERLQKSLPTPAASRSDENLEDQLRLLKELLGRDDLSAKEREGLEEKLKALKGQLPEKKKPFFSLEESPLPQVEKRFFIQGRYWLGYIEGSNKQVASYYSIATTQPLGSPVETMVSPAGAFLVSAGYRHSDSRTTTINFWNLDSTGSINRSANATVGISGTEGSNYYYQNIHQWGTGTFATKGVNRVNADSQLKMTNVDLIHSITVGKNGDKELGAAIGLKYVQLNSNHSINYSSTTATLYNISSDVENNLAGPVLGVSWRDSLYRGIRFNGVLDLALAWNHVKSKRYEYDNTISRVAMNATQETDMAVPIIDAELGVSYPLFRNLLVSLDYKAAFFGGMPFELKPKESTLLDSADLIKKDLLFHGITAGLTYAF